VFKPGLFPDADVVMYFDLDVIIQKPLDPFVGLVRSGDSLHIMREWNPALWSLLPVETLRTMPPPPSPVSCCNCLLIAA